MYRIEPRHLGVDAGSSRPEEFHLHLLYSFLHWSGQVILSCPFQPYTCRFSIRNGLFVVSVDFILFPVGSKVRLP
jgi:hypothetical protein